MAALLHELEAWNEAGRVAELWWRDDDATATSPALDTLLDISSEYRIPCNLAVIPVKAEVSLRERLAGSERAWVLLHGYAHVNHAPRGSGEGAWELGLHRPLETVLNDLQHGREILKSMFGERFVPVVVPPWNRIDPSLYQHLPGLGLTGVSAEWTGNMTPEVEGVRIVPAHADLLRWKKKQASFAGTDKVVRSIVDHLRAKRSGKADQGQPTGVLTHHLEMDEAAWEFMNTLAEATTTHGACRWLAAKDIFTQGSIG